MSEEDGRVGGESAQRPSVDAADLTVAEGRRGEKGKGTTGGTGEPWGKKGFGRTWNLRKRGREAAAAFTKKEATVGRIG